MHTGGIIVYIISVLFAVNWGILMRYKAKKEHSTEKPFEVFGLLLFVSVILIPVFSISPFHLLWMSPVAYILGFLSLVYPFKLLWPIASLYSSLWYIGLKNVKKEIIINETKKEQNSGETGSQKNV
jgi:hypothetical protein